MSRINFRLEYPEEIVEVLQSDDVMVLRSVISFFTHTITERLEFLLNNACINLGVSLEDLKNRNHKRPDPYTQELLNEAYQLLNILEKVTNSYNKMINEDNRTTIKSILDSGKTDTSKN